MANMESKAKSKQRLSADEQAGIPQNAMVETGGFGSGNDACLVGINGMGQSQ